MGGKKIFCRAYFVPLKQRCCHDHGFHFGLFQTRTFCSRSSRFSLICFSPESFGLHDQVCSKVSSGRRGTTAWNARRCFGVPPSTSSVVDQEGNPSLCPPLTSIDANTTSTAEEKVIPFFSSANSSTSSCTSTLPPPLSLHPPPYASWWQRQSTEHLQTSQKAEEAEGPNGNDQQESVPSNESTSVQDVASASPTFTDTGKRLQDNNSPPNEANRHRHAISTPAAPPPLVGESFLLWSPFIPSTADLHQALLLEAHEKHGVDLNVPPQAPPPLSSSFPAEKLSSTTTLSHDTSNVDVEEQDMVDVAKEDSEQEGKRSKRRVSHTLPTNLRAPVGSVLDWSSHPSPTPVPVPWYPPSLALKMQEVSSHFQYAPTHGPPPLHTTGSHALAGTCRYSTEGSRGGPSQPQQRAWWGRYQRALALRNAEWKALWQRYRRRSSEKDGLGTSMHPSPASVEMEWEDVEDINTLDKVPEEQAPDTALSSSSGIPTSTVSPSCKTTTTMEEEEEVLRAPVKEGMQCHCRVCGRAYRQRSVAVAHVRFRHDEDVLAVLTKTRLSSPLREEVATDQAALLDDAAATFVVDGPGEGEILAVVTNAATGGTPTSTGKTLPPRRPSSSSTTLQAGSEVGQAEGEGSTAVRATPAGAARGVKRRLTIAHSGAGAVTIPSVGSNGGGGGRKKGVPAGSTTSSSAGASSLQRLSIRERSLLYANPFGPAAEAAAEAAKLEEQEPVNPFQCVKEYDAVGAVDAGRPEKDANTMGTASLLNPAAAFPSLSAAIGPSSCFYCPLCLRRARPSSSITGGSTLPPFPNTHEKPFSCRLLDRLMDHLEDVHAEEGGVDALDPSTLATLYDQQNYPWRSMQAALPLSGGASDVPPLSNEGAIPSTPITSTREDATGASSRGSTVQVGVAGASQKPPAQTCEVADGRTMATASVVRPSSPTRGEEAGSSSLSSSPTEIPHASSPSSANLSLRIHSRLFCNTLLKGSVVDVQHGYTAKRLVLQYVMKVIGREGREALLPVEKGSAENGEQEGREEVVGKPKEAEEELIVVRYQGDPTSFTALRSSIHVGTEVLAVGNLRLDRRLDTLSKRYHPYPVVIVVPPYGSIRALS